MKKFIIYIFTFVCLSFIACQKEPSEISTPPFQVYNSPATSVKPTPDHGFIISSKNGTNWEFRKISEDGTVAWATSMESFQEQRANLSIQTFTPSIDGGCMIFGEYYIDTSTYNRSVSFIAKLNSHGSISNFIPEDTLFTAGSQHFFASTLDKNGNYLVIKKAKTTLTENYLFRINSDGIIISKFIMEDYLDYKKIVELPDNNFLVLGMNKVVSVEDIHYFLDKIDAFGNSIWSINLTNSVGYYFFNSPENKIIISDLLIAPDGRYYLAGHTNKFNDANDLDYDFFLEKIDSSGSIIDSLSWPGLASEYCKSSILSQDGSVYLIGATCSLPPLVLTNSNTANIYYDKQYNLSTRVRMYVLKTDSELHLVWKKSFVNNSGSEGVAIQETNDGSILLLGNKIGFGNKNIINLFSLHIDSDGNEY